MLVVDQHPIPLAPGQTVLSAVEAAGIPIPTGCRSGQCQSCLVRAVKGQAPAAAQAGLTDAQKAEGYFLACVCIPTEPLTVIRPDQAANTTTATIHSLEPLTADIILLRLSTIADFPYRPGQFVNLTIGDVTRSYSIASHPAERAELDLHIRLYPDGKMSRQIGDGLTAGDRVQVAGPFGTCFYQAADGNHPLVLAGTGTGLAPLLGIVKDALSHGHSGPITLLHGALAQSQLYADNDLRALADRHANLIYHPCVKGEQNGEIADALLQSVQPNTHYYLCGDAPLVAQLRKKLFLAGVGLSNIHADPFVAAA